MLLGQYTASLGDKNRLSVPKKFRDELGGRLIIAKWYEKCLVIISEKNWEQLLNRLTGNSQIITSPVRDTDRFILGSATEVEPDSLGRVVLPAYLRQYANLSSEVVFLGLGDRVEVWNHSDWTKREEYIANNADQLVETLAKNNNGSTKDIS